MPLHFAITEFRTLVNTQIASVTPHTIFIAMQQIFRLRDVMSVCRCRRNIVNQEQRIIDSNMQFHAKMPFAAFLDLVHLRITFTLLILCG